MSQQLAWTACPALWAEEELPGVSSDEVRNRAEASDLRRFAFASSCSACLDSEAISASKAARQIQRALPDGAGRAWRREGLARLDGRHYGSTVHLGPRGQGNYMRAGAK